VQRGYLGVTYYAADDLSEDQLKQLGIPTNVEGVYVTSVAPDGGAASAGIKKGDVITKVNGSNVVSGIQMSAQIAGFHPGDKVPVTYLRSGKEYTVNITLKKKSDVITGNASSRLGGDLSTLDKSKASKYGIDGGVVVNKVSDNGVLRNARVQPGFIITSVITGDGEEQQVSSVEDLNNILQGVAGTIRIRGIYTDYGETYTYPLNLNQ
jgi:serine protease Do